MAFYAYMLECADKSFYVGHTDNLEGRICAHQSGEIPGYTSTRLPVKLLWSQEFSAREDALAAERQVKGWNRNKKMALVKGDWLEIQRLACGVRNPLPERLR